MSKLSHADNPIQFYTATILEWKHLLKPDKYKQIIIESLAYLVKEQRVKVFGFVIMSNHIHLIWQGTQTHSLKHSQLSFMKYTAQQIKFDLQKNHPKVLPYFTVDAKDRKYQFWERNPLSIDIMSSDVFVQKLNYIHKNPLRANLCELETDYYYSSVKHYLETQHDFHFLEPYEKQL